MVSTFAKAVIAGLVLATVACATRDDLTLKPADLAGIDGTRGPAPSYRESITPLGVGLQEALAQTLVAARLARAHNGRFRLDATLLSLERPYAGFAMTVTATIAYRLTDLATGTVVYDKPLATLGTATLDDAITNENRLRIADERAVRANLRRLVEELYALPDRPLTSSRRT